MKTKNGHTQISTIDDDDDVCDIADVESQNEYTPSSQKTSNSTSVYLITALSCITFLGIAAVLFVLMFLNQFDGSQSTETNAEKGYSIIAELMESNMSFSHFTARQQATYHRAFNLFDSNRDGQLDPIEFQSFFELHLYVNHNNVFCLN